MDEWNKITRRKLKEICTVREMDDLMNAAVLSDEEKDIIKMHYINQKSLTYIADELGISESALKKKHRKLLRKIGKVIIFKE